ncbi:MAG: M48 family metallopeptidase [Pirellulaceae bacterium]
MTTPETNPAPIAASHKACPRGHQNAGQGRFCQQCGQPLMVVANGQPAATDVTTSRIDQRYEALPPLAPNYIVSPQLYQWSLDAQAMSRLRSITPLTALAKRVSDRAGRRWVESTCNGIRLGSNQLPEIHELAVHAARALGMRRMPVVYLSGEQPWDAMTFGSEEQAFIVIGSALAASFRGPEMLFILAREMGRIVAGHTLWRTVIRFLVGEMNPRSGLLRGGVAGLLDPGKWLEGAIELPLLGWARQAEITADRAGMLVVGQEEIARRTLMAWSLKAPNIPPRINLEAWLQQQEEDAGDQGMQLSEMLTSSTPYIARRLKLLGDYTQDPNFQMHRRAWDHVLGLPGPTASNAATPPARPAIDPAQVFTTACPHCGTKLHVPRSCCGKTRSPCVARMPVAGRCMC